MSFKNTPMARSAQPGIAPSFGAATPAGLGERCGQLPLRHCRTRGRVPHLVPQRRRRRGMDHRRGQVRDISE